MRRDDDDTNMEKYQCVSHIYGKMWFINWVGGIFQEKLLRWANFEKIIYVDKLDIWNGQIFKNLLSIFIYKDDFSL